MADIKTIEFKYDKGQAYLMMAAYIAWLFISIRYVLILSETYIKALAIFCSIFWFFSAFYFMRRNFVRVLKGKAALELNKDEIVDFIGKRRFRWVDVKDVVSVRNGFLKSYNAVAINLFDENEYYKTLNFFHKKRAATTKFFFKTPIVIYVQIMAYDNTEIVLSVQDYFEKVKNAS